MLVIFEEESFFPRCELWNLLSHFAMLQQQQLFSQDFDFVPLVVRSPSCDVFLVNFNHRLKGARRVRKRFQMVQGHAKD